MLRFASDLSVSPPCLPSCLLTHGPPRLDVSIVSCRNLVPEAVAVGTAQPGMVEVNVKAVGINFR